MICRAMCEMSDVGGAFKSMGVFLLAAVGGNLAYQLLVLPLIYLVVWRRNPLAFLSSLAKPWLMAFAPPSS